MNIYVYAKLQQIRNDARERLEVARKNLDDVQELRNKLAEIHCNKQDCTQCGLYSGKAKQRCATVKKAAFSQLLTLRLCLAKEVERLQDTMPIYDFAITEYNKADGIQ